MIWLQSLETLGSLYDSNQENLQETLMDRYRLCFFIHSLMKAWATVRSFVLTFAWILITLYQPVALGLRAGPYGEKMITIFIFFISSDLGY